MSMPRSCRFPLPAGIPTPSARDLPLVGRRRLDRGHPRRHSRRRVDAPRPDPGRRCPPSPRRTRAPRRSVRRRRLRPQQVLRRRRRRAAAYAEPACSAAIALPPQARPSSAAPRVASSPRRRVSQPAAQSPTSARRRRASPRALAREDPLVVDAGRVPVRLPVRPRHDRRARLRGRARDEHDHARHHRRYRRRRCCSSPRGILADNDRKELIARGYEPAPSVAWMLLLPPIVYLLVRRRVVGPRY